MNKQNKNGKNKANLEEMVKSGSQIVLLRDDGSEQPIEEIKIKADDAWECSDYKEVINLMAELICRLEQK